MTEYTPEHRGDPADESPPLVGDPSAEPETILSGRLYDVVKKLALIYLPAFGALYFGLAGIWGLPNAEQVVGSIVVIDTFLGALVGVASSQYNNSPARFDGTIAVSKGDEESMQTNLNVSLDPLAVATKKEIVVKIDRQ